MIILMDPHLIGFYVGWYLTPALLLSGAAIAVLSAALFRSFRLLIVWSVVCPSRILLCIRYPLWGPPWVLPSHPPITINSDFLV